MPQIIRESASLQGEVAVMGDLNHLVVRNAEELRKSIAGAVSPRKTRLL